MRGLHGNLLLGHREGGFEYRTLDTKGVVRFVLVEVVEFEEFDVRTFFVIMLKNGLLVEESK